MERFSNECRKTKTKVITLANKKGQRQSSKPIKLEVITRSRHKARENVHARATIGFSFTSDWLKKWRENFEPITEWSNAKPKEFTNYFRHSIENRSKCENRFYISSIDIVNVLIHLILKGPPFKYSFVSLQIWPFWPRWRLNIVLNFTFESQALRANLPENERIPKWRSFWSKVYAFSVTFSF